MKPTIEFIEETYSLRKDYRNIARIFSYGRPAGSANETYYVERFCKNPILMKMGMTEDGYSYDGKEGGNLFLKIGKDPKVLFSCHTDTVDRGSPFNAGDKKEIMLDISDMRIKKKDRAMACLGADDGTGIWLCWELIKAGVEGLYIFHRAEEVGGRGSSYIANNDVEELEKYDFAVAFDRKDNFSIITQQVGQVCASQEFVDSLSEQLGMNHRADPGGSFTDTANYTDYISECTNLSVGYFNAHSGNEQQDLDYVREFRDALIKVDWNRVIAKREPGVQYPPRQESSYSSYGGYGNSWGWSGRGVSNNTRSSYSSFGVSKKDSKTTKLSKDEFFDGYDNYEEEYLLFMMKEYPEQMSEIVSLETVKDSKDNVPTITIRQIESPIILDVNFIYDDWQKFFSV
jgi:hypothetical protein